MAGNTWDFIVVGGGSSGCVVASRLSEHGTVLLVEAGEHAERNPDTLSADGFVKAFSNDRVMWDRLSSSQDACAKRHLYVGTGRGMGGSGAVNGMVYTRGDKHDFAQWPEGWQWDDMVPAFDAIEQHLRVRTRAATAFSECGIAAAQTVGFLRKDRLDDGELKGFMGYQLMNFEGDKRRHSYAAFVADRRPVNLGVLTSARVERVILDADKRATGIVAVVGGVPRTYNVRHEVVLCAGALETPKLLMLSGIGPREDLQHAGIECLVDAAGVGRHLQDHPNVCLFYRGQQVPDSFYPQVYGFERINPALPLAANAPDTCFVFYTAHASIRESVQRMLPTIMLPPSLYRFDMLKRMIRALVGAAFMLPWLQQFVARVYGIVVILGKPLSRGSVRLRSNDPADAPVVDPCFYSNPADMDTLVDGVLKARAMAVSPAFRAWGNTALSAAARTNDRRRIADWIRSATMTTFHFCGSCRMGNDHASPVDPALRVKGVRGLRVADASVMPEIPVSALNAPSMAIAWRAADFIATDFNKNGQATWSSQSEGA